MTLEDLLRTTTSSTDKNNNSVTISPDFRVAIQKKDEHGVHFIIHPMNINGKTLDFICKGNSLKPI